MPGTGRLPALTRDNRGRSCARTLQRSAAVARYPCVLRACARPRGSSLASLRFLGLLKAINLPSSAGLERSCVSQPPLPASGVCAYTWLLCTGYSLPRSLRLKLQFGRGEEDAQNSSCCHHSQSAEQMCLSLLAQHPGAPWGVPRAFTSTGPEGPFERTSQAHWSRCRLKIATERSAGK